MKIDIYKHTNNILISTANHKSEFLFVESNSKLQNINFAPNIQVDKFVIDDEGREDNSGLLLKGVIGTEIVDRIKSQNYAHLEIDHSNNTHTHTFLIS